MSSLLETIAPAVSWVALVVSIGAGFYVWFGTRLLRTLLAKRRELASTHAMEPSAPDYRANPFYQFLRALRDQGIKDPDVNLFIAVFEGNTEQLKQAIDQGANVNITDTELVARYRPQPDGDK